MTTHSDPVARAWFSLGLSFIAGLVDVTTFVTLRGLFSAHVTGNIAVLAADIVHGTTVGLLTALAVPIFIGVTFVVTVVHLRLGTDHLKHAAHTLWVQTALIAAAGICAVLGDSRGPAIGVIACGIAAITAMALQNAMLHLEYRRVPSTAVMTGNIVGATVAVAELATGPREVRGTARAAWRTYWPLLAGFCAGAVVAAMSAMLPGHWVWALSTVASLTVATVMYVRLRSPDLIADQNEGTLAT